MMKAFHIQSRDGENQEIVFAETVGKAKVKSEAYRWCDYTELRASREIEFDKYADLGYVPKNELLKSGWWFTCQRCSITCTEENSVVVEEKVYCKKCNLVQESVL